MSASEHVRMAERALAAARESLTPDVHVRQALAEATLALVEQQRLGNLVALLALPEDGTQALAGAAVVDWAAVAHEVRKGLHIS